MAGPVAGETAGRATLMLEEFPGGTGASAAKLLRQSLERSGRFTLATAAGWKVRASSSACRIDGALVAADGKVLFNNHYDWPDLRDNAHAFADDIVEAVTGGTGIALSKIAFVSDRTGHSTTLSDKDGYLVITGFDHQFPDRWNADTFEPNPNIRPKNLGGVTG